METTDFHKPRSWHTSIASFTHVFMQALRLSVPTLDISPVHLQFDPESYEVVFSLLSSHSHLLRQSLFVLSTGSNHLKPFLIFVTTTSFTLKLSLNLHHLRRALISTTFIPLSCLPIKSTFHYHTSGCTLNGNRITFYFREIEKSKTWASLAFKGI